MIDRKKRSPTIMDVAAAAGVSKSTAARALSSSPNVAEGSRRRVLEVALATGYETNHLARSLRSGKTGMIGLVIPDIANPFWAEVARGAQDEASRCGASLLVFSSDWNPDREAAHLRALRQARVEGAIVNPVDDGSASLDNFGLPVVLIGSSAERFPDQSSVGSDIAQGVALGLDHLASLGHHRPALLLGPRNRLARARFVRVVHDHCISRDIDPATLPVEEGGYTVDEGRLAMGRLLAKQDQPVRSVFAANDLMAIGAILALRDAGLRCPEDVSVLGFDGIPAGAYADPGLTTVGKPARAIGTEGIKLLTKSGAETAVQRHTFLDCALIERGSLAGLDDTGPRRVRVSHAA